MAIGFAMVLLAAEIVLRFMPVSSGLRSQPVNAENPVFHFEANRTSVYSAGWDMRHATRVHVNNAGFVNDADYDASQTTPLMAIIGDSYVEALIVPHPLTAQGCLARWAGDRGRVYSLAASGAPLSQYLVWAKEAYETYRADAAVFVIVGNDFDESLEQYKRAPGFHHFRETDGRLDLEMVPYAPSRLRELVYSSALGKYLVFNLQLPSAVQTLRRYLDFSLHPPSTAPTPRQGQQNPSGEGQGAPKQYVGNTDATASTERLTASRRAVESFFSKLQRTAPWKSKSVVFVIDAIRPFVYDGHNAESVRSSYFAQMRDYFMTRARELGYIVIDLHPLFAQIHRRNGLSFEFIDDSHWNEHGHRVAAEEVARLPLYRNVFGMGADEVQRQITAGCGPGPLN
jgi:hypothetical protein